MVADRSEEYSNSKVQKKKYISSATMQKRKEDRNCTDSGPQVPPEKRR
jgi:hypothetical protein